MEKKQDQGNALDTLEELETKVTASVEKGVLKDGKTKKPKGRFSINGVIATITNRLNVYLLGFILLAIVSLIVVFVVINKSNQEAAREADISTQELTQEAIDDLTSNEVTVGDPKQLLSIESNAVFSGKVLIRDGLDVAGPIKVGGNLSLPGITVSGTSKFDEVQLNSLSIAGDTNVQGVLTVQSNLSISGTASFGGAISAPSLTVDALSLSGDIQFGRHIDAGGGTPGVATGSAVGSGGTVTISGSDTAGTVTINKGSGSGSGTLAVVTFNAEFSGSPHVVITPVTTSSSLAAGTYYLSSRTSTGFTISVGSLSATGSISFDYVVID